MKTTLAFLLSLISSIATADLCTVVIRDHYGYDFDIFGRSSYSINAACDDATWDCRQKLSLEQSYGRHYDSQCVVKEVSTSSSYPPPYPPSYPPSYPPRYPDYPRRPNYPHDRRDDRRDDRREPPRHEPGSEPRRPGPR